MSASTLERRVAHLENQQPVEDRVTDILLVFMQRADEAPPEITSLTSGDQRWERGPGETEEELRARASREVRRTGPVALFCSNTEACPS